MEAAFPGEYDRIEKYSTGQRGDVATWSQLFDYLMLHWDHPATK